MAQELKFGKMPYEPCSGVSVCLRFVPMCLVGVRTVHHDVWFWRGCSILRHVRVNGFFLDKENTVFRKEASNQMGAQI